MKKDNTIYKYSVLVSSLLAVFLLLIFFRSTDFFIDIFGLSFRPYFLLIVPLFLLLKVKYNRSEFNRMTTATFLWLIVLSTGLLPIIFFDVSTDYSAVTKNVFLVVIQWATFGIVGFSLLSCDKAVLKRSIENILPFIVVPPLLMFAINGAIHFGETNTTYLGVFLGHDGLPRAMGFFSDPNYFSLYMMGILYIVFLLNRGSIMPRKTQIYVLVIIANVLFSFSRSGIAVLVLFLLLCGLFRLIKVKKFFYALLIVFATASLFNNYIYTTVVNKFLQKDGSSSERFELILIGLNAPLNHPLGVGVGNEIYYYEQYYGTQKLAHNDFLTVLIECGIIGVLAYLAIYLILFFYTKCKLARICVLCFMLHLCTLSGYSYDPIIPVFVCFVCYISNIVPNRKPPDIFEESKFISAVAKKI